MDPGSDLFRAYTRLLQDKFHLQQDISGNLIFRGRRRRTARGLSILGEAVKRFKVRGRLSLLYHQWWVSPWVFPVTLSSVPLSHSPVSLAHRFRFLVGVDAAADGDT